MDNICNNEIFQLGMALFICLVTVGLIYIAVFRKEDKKIEEGRKWVEKEGDNYNEGKV